MHPYTEKIGQFSGVNYFWLICDFCFDFDMGFFLFFFLCFFTVITTYFYQISQNPILRLELWTINVLNIKIKKRKKLTRWVEADLLYHKIPGLSYTLISNKGIKSHTYLDFVRTVLKAKGKQH